MTNLTEYEQSFVDRTGYWTEEKENQRFDYRIKRAADRMASQEKEVFTISINEWECYVPGVNGILGDYMDIASLFANNDLIGGFLDSLFSYSLDNDIDGLSPFYYHEKSKVYNFDYNYILYMIIRWSTQILEADEDDMFRFMRRFKAGTNTNFLGSNHFLIHVLFGEQFGLIGSKFINPRNIRSHKIARACYCNSIVIGTDTGEKIFFYGIPIKANMILKYCSRHIVERVLEGRDNLNIKQVYFGKDAAKYRAEDIFFKIDFPD